MLGWGGGGSCQPLSPIVALTPSLKPCALLYHPPMMCLHCHMGEVFVSKEAWAVRCALAKYMFSLAQWSWYSSTHASCGGAVLVDDALPGGILRLIPCHRMRDEVVLRLWEWQSCILFNRYPHPHIHICRTFFAFSKLPSVITLKQKQDFFPFYKMGKFGPGGMA